MHTVFVRLGLDEWLGGARKNSAMLADSVFVMVANRLISRWSKRRAILEWLDTDVQLPPGVAAPSLDQLYRALDAIAELKPEIEQHLYAQLITLLGLELRLCCYDLTSTYFETATPAPERFSSKRFGYSRDHRPDRPQVMIELLVTGEGIPRRRRRGRAHPSRRRRCHLGACRRGAQRL